MMELDPKGVEAALVAQHGDVVQWRENYMPEAIRLRENDMQAAITAYLSVSPLSGDGWQGIDTAPRDGTMILLWNKSHNQQAVLGWSIDLGLEVYPDGAWTDAGSKNQAISVCYNGGYFQFWRPLPAPPRDEVK